jgi:uncharacterized membrane protein
MSEASSPSRVAFALVLIGLGILGLVYGNSAAIWELIPKSTPARPFVIYCCSLIELAGGACLFLPSFMLFGCRLLVPFFLSWLVLLKLPGLVTAPQVMVRWETFGETAALLAGVWCLYAADAGRWDQAHLKFAVGESGIRAARLLFIAALPMFGLAHFAYADLTASLVPKWMSFPFGWTYLTGAASLAAAAGMLLGIYPRLAVNLEAAMLWIFTGLVWLPRVVASPGDQGNWTELLISGAIAAGAGLVAHTYRSARWWGRQS